MNAQKSFFSTKRLATIGMFVAIAYLLSFLSFPIFPTTPYLKLDFGNVFILLPALLFGPVEGIFVCLVKELLALLNSTTGGVGEIANFLMTTSYILLPSLIYRFRKGLRAVFLSLIGACVIGTTTAACVNRFIVFPLYMGKAAPAVFESVFGFVVAFNAVKTVAISVLTFLLYKRLSAFLKKIAVK